MIYVVDTSEWINPYRRYPEEVFPSLWKHVELLISDKRISSPREVLDEVKRGQDGLVDWLKMRRSMFRDTGDLIGKANAIIKEHPRLVNPNATHEIADPYVIALAMWYRDHTVDLSPIIVTDENLHRISGIPYAARANGIQTCKLMEMIQREGWTF